MSDTDTDTDIAIVGMAAHLPGAFNVDEYWQNLRNGVESVRELSEEELIEAGVKREKFLRPGYVRAAAPLDKMEYFDADFFGFSPKEAAIMDPQHRHFLEACWEAMEDAGHVPESFDGAVGVFAGCGMNGYFMFNLLSNRDLVDDVGMFLLRHTGNDKDFLATRASYLFDLHGPAINVQTACSTSLVAAHLACQHLLSGECDMALAGGVTIEMPHKHGYQYEEGEILSPDGHCRAFDHRSEGTVFGSGVGVVVLRRLQDAIDDGDHIYAVIKGTAVNNDGAQKVGYLAPSVDGQAACITEALAVADVEPESIGYVECHGTGTPMGDPIEVAALTEAFRSGTDKTGYCRIGSVKTNIGHLDTAAGVASLIKVSLSLKNREIPPSLNYERANPSIDFDNSPFLVNHERFDWHREGTELRRAGVNSLGVGGTNAFAVLEEAPEQERGPENGAPQLLVISGKNRAALDENTRNLARHLAVHPELDLADVAWTLQVGRRAFGERRVLAARDSDEAISLLQSVDARRVFSHTASSAERAVAFMFPGGGAQYVNMARDLYRSEPVFTKHVDEGFRLLSERHGLDLAPLLFCADDAKEDAGIQLEQPSKQLPAIFIVEYALAQLLIGWGITPTALLGHSVGENTAACVAGTMSFPDCLGLVVLRGRLMDRTAGGMVTVPLTPEELAPYLDELGLDLAVVNASDLCVASGPDDRLELLEQRLRAEGVEPQRVKIGIAAHSRMLEPVLDEFGAYLRGIPLSAPTIPWVSNRTGTWITDEQATDPDYWVGHLRGTVRFADCVATLAEDAERVFIEVGPGKTLSSLTRMSPAFRTTHAALPTLRHADEVVGDDVYLLTLVGRLWAVGCPLDTARLFPEGGRRRVGLPTYAFQSQPFFIPPGVATDTTDRRGGSFIDREDDEARWFWETRWKSEDRDEPVDTPLSWLVFLDELGVGDRLVTRLRERGDEVVVVHAGDSYRAIDDLEYVIAPEHGRLGYDNLVRDLARTGHLPDRIAHLALLAKDDQQFRPGGSFLHRNQELGFYSLVFLAQAWSAENIRRPLHIVVTTMGAQHAIDGDDVQWPEQATVLGPAMVIPQEIADVTVSCVDLDPRDLAPTGPFREGLESLIAAAKERAGGWSARRAPARAAHPERRSRLDLTIDSLADELLAPANDDIVALRGDRRYVRDLRRVSLSEDGTTPLRDRGVVLITGGLGGIGLTIAEQLFDAHGARLALMSRSPMPERERWDEVVRRLGDAHPTSRRIAHVRALEARGAEVLLLDGDVSDVDRVRQAVQAIRARFGAINGVIHAAGVVHDDLLVLKSQSDLEEVLASKVYGTLVLDEAVAGDDLDLFVVLSSTSTVTAPVGQVDYVAANSFLNAFAESRRARGDQHVFALNWGVWNEVGMAADAAGRMRDRGEAMPVLPCEHPMFDSRITDAKGVTTLRSRWSPEAEWFLDEHRSGSGEALLPGAGYLELARAAMAEIGVSQPFEIRDLTFLRPLAVADGTTVEVSTTLAPNEEGYLLDVRERVVVGGSSAEDGPSAGKPGWRRTGQASLLLYPQPPVPAVDLAAAEARCTERGAVRTRQQDHLGFGPRWDVVERVQLGDGEAMAWLQLHDRFGADLGEFDLHPALVDLGTGFAMELIEGYTGDTLWVPIGYQSIRVFRPLPHQVISLVTVRPESTEASGFASFDVTLTDVLGEVLVQVQSFTIKRLDGPLDLGLGRNVLATDVEFDAATATERQLSQSELVFRHNLQQGIVPEEGKRAFARALGGAKHAQIFVTSLDLTELRAQSQASARAQTQATPHPSGAVFARPTLDSEYAEPRNDIEQSLVVMWQELLGISEIGVHDSFFDLGGHSLIAVRLFARVKKTFGVDFPISILFEAPTVAACADLIAAARPEGADEDAGSSTVVAPRPRYTHLVAMHAGEGGPKTPFFLVAGMFGNVLNLRHLAHQIGTERPFYGVQARGLYGDEQPHDDFVEMAADYLVEVRSVQPDGPYLLGGFSGGGIVALEMARQLLEAGQAVGLVVLLDTPTPHNPPLTIADRVKIQTDTIRKQGAGYLKTWAVNRVLWEQEKRRRRRGPVATADAGALHSEAIEAAFYRALESYDLKHYPGVLTLYRPKLTPLHVLGPDRQIDVTRRFIFSDNGWTPYCERVDVTEVPGDHNSMVLEPNVRVLGAHLRDVIVQTENRWATTRSTG